MVTAMEQPRFNWASAVKLGLLGGAVGIYLCLVGLVPAFSDDDIIGDVISFGLTLLILTSLGFGYAASERQPAPSSRSKRALRRLLAAALAGLITGVVLALLVVIGDNVNLRSVFINASPELYDLLTFGRGIPEGLVILILGSTLVGILGGGISLLPHWARHGVLAGLAIVITGGLLRDILRVVVTGQKFLVPLSDFLFASEGLSPEGAIALFVVSFALTAAWSLKGQKVREEIADLPAQRRRVLRWSSIILSLVILLILPLILRTFLTNVMDRVGLFILMGLGLNIVVGFAGLLDLGYVAFYAIGAYTMGVLSTTGHLGGTELSFWTALPIAVGASVLAGVILGVPVLHMRGDYLAIVTLGFGEIIRILALSNALKPYIGGAQGILPIPRPIIFGIELDSFQSLYYLILVGCAVAFFISGRLRDSRLGRSWMALREDEDVAEAMGINLISVKLLAFATGAGLAGASGAIFASQVGSIYPHSFQLWVSILVLCVIIVGGIGSLPGVVLGSLFLVGLPEVLSELQDFRLLFYGAALILVMLLRPEGLWPEATHRRELHAGEVEEPLVTADARAREGSPAD